MYKLSITVTLLFCLIGVTQTFAGVVTVTIPDPSPLPTIFLGSGSASVTYSGVVFSQNGAMSDSNFFDVGPIASGFPAVLSSQEQTWGLANILISLPSPTSYFALNYGTFNGSLVTFTLSNGYTTTLASTGFNGYDVPDAFSVTSSPFSSVLVTSPDFVLNLNNITYALPNSTTPEPSSLILLGPSLLALGSRLSRQMR